MWDEKRKRKQNEQRRAALAHAVRTQAHPYELFARCGCVCVWMCTIAGKTAKSFQEAAGEFKTELQKGMEEDTADALEATKDDSPGEAPPSED